MCDVIKGDFVVFLNALFLKSYGCKNVMKKKHWQTLSKIKGFESLARLQEEQAFQKIDANTTILKIKGAEKLF